MKRAKIKRPKEKMPTDSEIRKIMAASHMVLAETFIYMHGEYGYGNKRCKDIIDAYYKTMVDIHKRSVTKATFTGKSITPAEVMREAQELVTVDLGKLPIEANNAYILEADRLVMSCMIIALKKLTGFGKQRLDRWVEGYVALVNEVFNPRVRSTVQDIVNWANECVGINIMAEFTWD